MTTGIVTDEYGNAYALPGPFATLRDVQREHRERGGYYFEADTARYFRARYHATIYAGAMFIDSVSPPGGPREYRVSVIGDGRGVNRVHGGDGFATLAAAKRHALQACESARVSAYLVGADAPSAWGPVAKGEGRHALAERKAEERREH